MKNTNPLLARLRHHISGAIERGEGQAIAEIAAPVVKVKITIHHGDYFHEETQEAQTVRCALALFKSAYLPGIGSAAFDRVARSLIASGEASHGWVDFSTEK